MPDIAYIICSEVNGEPQTCKPSQCATCSFKLLFLDAATAKVLAALSVDEGLVLNTDEVKALELTWLFPSQIENTLKLLNAQLSKATRHYQVRIAALAREVDDLNKMLTEYKDKLAEESKS